MNFLQSRAVVILSSATAIIALVAAVLFAVFSIHVGSTLSGAERLSSPDPLIQQKETRQDLLDFIQATKPLLGETLKSSKEKLETIDIKVPAMDSQEGLNHREEIQRKLVQIKEDVKSQSTAQMLSLLAELISYAHKVTGQVREATSIDKDDDSPKTLSGFAVNSWTVAQSDKHESLSALDEELDLLEKAASNVENKSKLQFCRQQIKSLHRLLLLSSGPELKKSAKNAPQDEAGPSLAESMLSSLQAINGFVRHGYWQDWQVSARLKQASDELDAAKTELPLVLQKRANIRLLAALSASAFIFMGLMIGSLFLTLAATVQNTRLTHQNLNSLLSALGNQEQQ